MADTDYYRVLGVSPSTDAAEIARAYRRLARQVHPDTGGDTADSDRFAGVAEAYSVLGDPVARRQYDRRRAGSGAGGRAAGRQDRHDRSADAVRIPVRVPMRGATRPAAAGRGADVRVPVALTFDQAVVGATVDVAVPAGAGRPARTVRAHVPAGVADGQAVRIRGHGQPGGGGSAGDLLLDVTVAPHPWLERRGHDLVARVPVSFTEAVLGADVDVPTPGGPVSVRVPPGTPSGTVLRVAGRGVPAQPRPGDLLVTVEVHVPRRLTDTERAAVERLAEVFRPPRPWA